jgi:hypothetical protein
MGVGWFITILFFKNKTGYINAILLLLNDLTKRLLGKLLPQPQAINNQRRHSGCIRVSHLLHYITKLSI